jgi:argininosuccinate lyase
VHPAITAEVYDVLTVDASVASRVSFGGTAPANVLKEAERWLAKLRG